MDLAKTLALILLGIVGMGTAAAVVIAWISAGIDMEPDEEASDE